MTEENLVSITFRILDIKVEKFTLSPPEKLNIPELGTEFTFNISTTFELNPKEKTLVWEIFGEIFLEPEKINFCGDIKVSYAYKIENFEEVASVHDGKVTIKDAVLNVLLQISLDTTRGILIEKTSGTNLQRAYFPIISTKRIIEQIKKNIANS